MDDLKKKILYGALLLVVAVLGMWAIYYVFFKGEEAPPAEEAPVTEVPTRPRPGLPPARPGEPPGVAILPPGILTPIEAPPEGPPPLPTIPSPIASGGLTTITQLTEQRVDRPTLAPNGRDITYYNKDEGRFYRMGPDGKPIPLSDKIFPNVETITWAPTTTAAILEFPDGANILYDFDQEKQVTLPKHWEEFSFAPTGNEIAFKTDDVSPEDRWLAIANPDGSSATPIEPLGSNGDKVTVNWSPNQQMIATFVESRSGTQQELVFLGKNQENFRLAAIEGRQFLGQWTPRGDKMLYSTASAANDFKPSLWIVDASPQSSGQNRRALELQTWADKCTIAGDNTSVYCAVPKELPRGAGLVRDIGDTISDNFYRLDLTTGTQTFLASPAGKEVTAENLVLSNDGQYLVFTDVQTGTLQRIQLK